MHAVTPVCQSANLSIKDLSLEEPTETLAKFWRINFYQGLSSVPRVTAAQRTVQFFEALKDEVGQWKEVMVRLPNGVSKRMYISKDKSSMQSEVEKLGKRLKTLAKEMLPERQIHLIRSHGIVSVDWLEVLKVECPAKGRNKLSWRSDNLATTGITDEIRRRITDNVHANSGTQAASSSLLSVSRVKWLSKLGIFKLFSWNCQTLCQRLKERRKAKFSFLYPYLQQHAVGVCRKRTARRTSFHRLSRSAQTPTCSVPTPQGPPSNRYCSPIPIAIGIAIGIRTCVGM